LTRFWRNSGSGVARFGMTESRNGADRRSPRSFNRKFQPYGLSHSDQRRQPRVSPRRQGAIQALALNPGGFGHLGNAASGFRNTTQRDQKHGGLFGVFQRRLQVLGNNLELSRNRRRMTSSCDSLVLPFIACVSSLSNRRSIHRPSHGSCNLRISEEQAKSRFLTGLGARFGMTSGNSCLASNSCLVSEETISELRRPGPAPKSCGAHRAARIFLRAARPRPMPSRRSRRWPFWSADYPGTAKYSSPGGAA